MMRNEDREHRAALFNFVLHQWLRRFQNRIGLESRDCERKNQSKKKLIISSYLF